MTEGKSLNMCEELKYDDIIHLPHHQSAKRARMSMTDRGAQFSPFAALVGYDDAIRETARLTGKRIELTEGEKLLLNERIQEIAEKIHTQPQVCITHFLQDLQKEGGEYVTDSCRVKKIDPYGRGLLLTDGRMLLFEDIIGLEEV